MPNITPVKTPPVEAKRDDETPKAKRHVGVGHVAALPAGASALYGICIATEDTDHGTVCTFMPLTGDTLDVFAADID